MSTMSNFTKLIPTQPVADFGPSSVGDYSVKGWNIVAYSPTEGIREVRVTVEHGRNIGSIFTVTYLPTILMNLVNQATNYTKNNYDLVMTVNITCGHVHVKSLRKKVNVKNNLFNRPGVAGAVLQTPP